MSTKISQLTQLTTPANADYVPIVQASSSTTKYILLSDFMKIATAIPNNTITAPMLATNAIALGYAQTLTSFATASTTVVQVTGLSASVTIPAGGRRVEIMVFAPYLSNTISGSAHTLSLWDGTVGSGTQLQQQVATMPAAGGTVPAFLTWSGTPAAGAKTYNVGLLVNSGTGTLTVASTSPGFILVKVT